jgi:GR25 family glycosyltransferase involved in LPS biosynthesis
MIQFLISLCAKTPVFIMGLPPIHDSPIVRHFKPVQNKNQIRQIESIDFIYLINLDQRPEKWAKSVEEFKKFNLSPYRFSAVNGWELPLQAVNDLGLVYKTGMTPLMATTFIEVDNKILPSPEFMQSFDKSYFCMNHALGAIGCTYSHLSIIFDALNSGYQTIWIVEDDVVLHEDPHRLEFLVKELDGLVGPNGWDLLYTDPDMFVQTSGIPKRPNIDCSLDYRFSKKFTDNSRINPHFKKSPSRFGTYSMVIRRSGMTKILNYFAKEKMFHGIDVELAMIPNLKKFGLTFCLTSQPADAPSDNAYKNYDESSENPFKNYNDFYSQK